MGVGPHQGWLLRLFGAHVTQAFGHTPYQVGSTLTQKSGWRDVDVRLIMPDGEFDALFGDLEQADNRARLRMWEFAWGALGREMTRLPIDFQFQQQTAANKEFPGVRSALVITEDELPIVRTKDP